MPVEELVGMCRHILKKRSEHLLRFLEFAAHRRDQVHVLKHERTQFFQRLHDLRRHGDGLVIKGQGRLDDVAHHPIDALTSRSSERRADVFRNVVLFQQAGPDPVVDVVIHVGDDVGDADDVALQGESARLRTLAEQLSLLALGMLQDSVAHLDRQIESAPVVLQDLHDAHRLPVVIEATVYQFAERCLAGMAEG